MRICRYCGKQVPKGQRSKEHIIPKSIGCNVFINNVCAVCNNEVLSDLDNELKTNSPLRYIMTTFGSSDWSYNPCHPFPLEHVVTGGYQSNKLWPQLILPGTGFMFFFAPESGISDDFVLKTFFGSLIPRIEKYGPKSLIWDKVQYSHGDFPTRIFTRNNIGDINPKKHFFCRYVGKIDKEIILQAIITASKKLISKKTKVSITEGCGNVDGTMVYDVMKVKRALTKICINAMAKYCRQTDISIKNFPHAIRFIRYNRQSYDLNGTGFINNHGIRWMKCPKDCNMIHIEPENGLIKCHISFLGGKAGAFSIFPGRVRDDWRRMGIIIGKGNFKPVCQTSRAYVAYPMPQIVMDPRLIMPSVPFTYMNTTIETKIIK